MVTQIDPSPVRGDMLRGEFFVIPLDETQIDLSPVRGDMSIADGVEISLSPVRGGMFIERMPKRRV